MKLHAHRRLAGLALALTLGWALPTYAAESGAYIGFAYGNSELDLGSSSDPTGFGAPITTDESDTGFALSFGYRFSPYIALDGTYYDFGASTLRLARPVTVAGILIQNISADAEVKGPALSFVGTIPAGNFELFGKLGVLFAKTELSGQVQGRTTGSPTQLLDASFSESASTTEVAVGLGMGYTFGEHFHVKLEWTQVPDAGDEEDTGEGDASLLALGLQFRF
jgi:hypothetical protein